MTDSRFTRGAPRVEVVAADDTHAAALAEFFRVVWNSPATAESVVESRATLAADNVAEPGVPPPTWIAVRAGRVLGYVTTVPVRLWDGQGDRPAYLIKGLMVLPEMRNGPIGYSVLKAASARLPRTAGLAVAPAARRLFEALGYSDLGAIPNAILPLSPQRLLMRVDVTGLGIAGLPSWLGPAMRLAQSSRIAAAAGWAGGLLLRASAAALRLPAMSREAAPLAVLPSPEELDALWKRVAGDGFPASVVRDSKHLLQRYGTGEGSPYLWVGVREQHVLTAVAILRRPRPDGDPRLRGIRLAVLSDLLYPLTRPATGLALLGAAEREARRLDADVLLASASAPSLQSLLRRQCYLPISGNVHFLFRDVADDSAFRQPLSGWWLTRGDGFADEVF